MVSSDGGRRLGGLFPGYGLNDTPAGPVSPGVCGGRTGLPAGHPGLLHHCACRIEACHQEDPGIPFTRLEAAQPAASPGDAPITQAPRTNSRTINSLLKGHPRPVPKSEPGFFPHPCPPHYPAGGGPWPCSSPQVATWEVNAAACFPV
jgi:hypothetical protein